MAKYSPVDVKFRFAFSRPRDEGEKLRFKFKSRAYIPPAGNKLAFNFTEPYTPDASKLGFHFVDEDNAVTPRPSQYVFPVGFMSVAFGDTHIRNKQRWVSSLSLGVQTRYGVATIRLVRQRLTVTPWLSSRFGSASIMNQHRWVRLSGWVSSRIGSPRVVLKNRYVRVPGIAPGGFGNGWVSHYVRNVAPATIYAPEFPTLHSIKDRTQRAVFGGIASQSFGWAALTHEVQYLEAKGALQTTFGAARLVHHRRYIYPAFIYSFASGTPTLSDGVRYIRIPSIVPPPTYVGWRLVVRDATQVVKMRGFISSRYSVGANLRDAIHRVYPRPIIPSSLYGSAVFSLSRRYITHVGDNGYDPALYGLPNIVLRNRTVRMGTINQLRFGVGTTIAHVLGDIRSVKVPGEVAFGAFRVTHKVQRVRFVGRDHGYVSIAAHLYNNARVVKMRGFTEAAVGTHTVYNLNRYLRHKGAWHESFGRPSIDYGVRALGVFSVRPQAQFVEPFRISLHTRYINMRSVLPTGRMGEHLHFIQKAPDVKMRGFVSRRDPFGYPNLRHRNRNVRLYGFDAHVFGRASFELGKKVVPSLSVGDTLRFGHFTIKDSTRVVYMRSDPTRTVFGVASIRNLLPDRPYTREVFAESIVNRSVFGEPELSLHGIFELGVRRVTSFGTFTIRDNVILMRAGFVSSRMGVPTIAGAQYVKMMSIAPEGETRFGMARFSPFRIYLPAGDKKPEGYHPENFDAHPVDGLLYRDAQGYFDMTKTRGAWVPSPMISHRIRYVSFLGLSPSGVGRPTISYPPEYKPTRVLRFQGWRQSRFGWITMMPHTVEAYMPGWRSSKVSEPSIQHGVRTDNALGGVGIPSATRFGTATVDYYNRHIRFTGFTSSTVGIPRQWPRVRHVRFQGLSSRAVYGTAYIDYRNRRVRFTGFDALNPHTAFDGAPMRIRNKYEGIVVRMQGFESSSFGGNGIGLHVRYVQMRGIFPYPASRYKVKAVTYVPMQGFDASAFGNIRQYIPGVIQLHETSHHTEFGRAHIMTPSLMQGFESSTFSIPRLAMHIGVESITRGGFGKASIRNTLCCGGCSE